MNTMKSLSLPVLTDLNFELWRQNLNLVAQALDVPDALAKDIKGLECKDPKHFYVLAQLILSSLSDHVGNRKSSRGFVLLPTFINLLTNNYPDVFYDIRPGE